MILGTPSKAPGETPDTAILRWWLNVATWDLVAPAQERIRLEIEAHYADAVETLVAEGRTRPEAQVEALAELGDARAAAKRFRQRHLTQTEAERLAKVLSCSRSPVWLLVFYVIIAAGFWYSFGWLRMHHRPLAVPAAAAFVVVLLNTMSCYVARSKGKGGVRLVLTLEYLTTVSVLGYFVWAFSWDGPSVMIVALLSCIRDLRLWWKLRKVSDPGLELTPCNTATGQ
jgi:hypothetical protein